MSDWIASLVLLLVGGSVYMLVKAIHERDEHKELLAYCLLVLLISGSTVAFYLTGDYG